MRISFSGIGNALSFSRVFRQLEGEMETVVKEIQFNRSAEQPSASATSTDFSSNWNRNRNSAYFGRRKIEKGRMRISFSGIGNALSFSRVFRQLEGEMETVVKVLQPGPLGIIEHKFCAEEIRQADATVRRAVDNWRRNAIMEQRSSSILKDFINN